jgi:glutamate-5-semialdehyde dehydrogenase
VPDDVAIVGLSRSAFVIYATVNAAFVGDAHTRWVDGQKALERPELGLSNWQAGRLFGRGGILSGDSVYTVRTRARTTG